MGRLLENYAYLGGTNADWASSVALDSQDNAYVLGSTESPNFPITSTNVFDPNFGTGKNTNAFITKVYILSRTSWEHR